MNPEITTEERKIAEEQLVKARKAAIKVAKHFSDLILSLPEDFELSQKGLDEQLEKRTEKLVTAIREDGFCLQDIESAIDILGVISSMTLSRCKNHTKTVLEELYKCTFNVYNPEKEMPIVEITDRVKKLQS